MHKGQKIVVWLVLILSTFAIFNDSLNSFFSQDDFFHLRQIMNLPINELPQIFIPKYTLEQTFYRPISRELFNFIIFNLFGLNALVFHLINYFLILINGMLLFVFLKKLTKEKFIAALSLIIYLISAVHSIELYYLASVQTLMSTTFVILTLLTFLNFLETKKWHNWFLSFICAVFAVGAHESSIVLIGMMACLYVYYKRKLFIKNWMLNLKKMIVVLFPFTFIVFARLWIHFNILGLPQQEVYKPVLSVSSITNSFVWFTLWHFGFPEMMTDFMTLTLHVNPNLFRWYADYIKVLIVCFVSMMIILGFIAVKFRRQILKAPILVLLILFYIISLSPFLFFPSHKFVYYLTLSTIWFSALIAFCLNLLFKSRGIKFKFLGAAFIILFAILSVNTIQLNKITHWSAKRASAAEFLLKDIKLKYPSVERNTTFIFLKDPNYPNISPEWGSSSKQAFYILSGSDGLQLMYHDSSIKALYEDINRLKANEKSIIYPAKFPY